MSLTNDPYRPPAAAIGPELPPEAGSLGELRSAHHPKLFRMAMNLAVGAVLITIGTVVFLVSTDILPVKRLTPGNPVGRAVGLFLFALFGGSLLYRAVRDGGLHVYVFDQGIAYLQYGKSGLCRWDSINEFYKQEVNWFGLGLRIKRHDYLIACDGGERLHFTRGLKKVDALINAVEQATLERLLRRALFVLEEGGEVQFGALSVGPQGVRIHNRALPWEEVGDVRVDKGTIRLRRGITAPRSWGNVWTPNSHVLVALFAELLGADRVNPPYD